MTIPHVTKQSTLRSARRSCACPGERIVESAAIRSTDADLGHTTFRTLENTTTSPLTNAQAAGLGRLVRRIVNSPVGLPGGFDTVEDLCRGYLAANLAAPTTDQVRAGIQRTLTLLRSTPA
ncbi:conserved hypothetical protein [Rhodococcus sp. RD6.2]|jgi:hypothetical protein|uniref:hypothetical protein n=1 Tax=Rhodococcus sp. RD6.2 TaxID=260936 RepID=UPI00063B688F|nr:hypothetical protein [Rhodococcus sp. RD6.2]CRK53497.1 conserved hypothetical protein [Rhodococcus sp. RD6.2]